MIETISDLVRLVSQNWPRYETVKKLYDAYRAEKEEPLNGRAQPIFLIRWEKKQTKTTNMKTAKLYASCLCRNGTTTPTQMASLTPSQSHVHPPKLAQGDFKAANYSEARAYVAGTLEKPRPSKA